MAVKKNVMLDANTHIDIENQCNTAERFISLCAFSSRGSMLCRRSEKCNVAPRVCTPPFPDAAAGVRVGSVTASIPRSLHVYNTPMGRRFRFRVFLRRPTSTRRQRKCTTFWKGKTFSHDPLFYAGLRVFVRERERGRRYKNTERNCIVAYTHTHIDPNKPFVE